MTESRLRAALAAEDSSARMQAALAAGTYPDPALVEPLVERCAVEPDLSVRETLTWALVRHPAEVTIPLLLREVRDGVTQARSQALHTLSKIGDPRGWTAITDEVIADPDDIVARTAWRAAVVLVPLESRVALAVTLSGQLGRGDRDRRFSLSRALVGLGDAADAILDEVATRSDPEDHDPESRTHAIATQRLALELDESFDASLSEARRFAQMTDARAATPDPPTP